MIDKVTLERIQTLHPKIRKEDVLDRVSPEDRDIFNNSNK